MTNAELLAEIERLENDQNESRGYTENSVRRLLYTNLPLIKSALAAQRDTLSFSLKEAEARVESAEAREKGLREALEFYANEATWHDHEWEYTDQDGDIQIAMAFPADDDRGERARTALAAPPAPAQGDKT